METKMAVQSGMERIKNWLNAFQLSLNVNKTHYLAFSLTESNRPDFVSIKITGLKNERDK